MGAVAPAGVPETEDPPAVAAAPESGERAERRPAAPAADGGAPGAAPAGGDAARDEGFLAGRLLDPEGRPVPGVEVHAYSRERSSKVSRYHFEGATDAAGGFRVAVRVALADGVDYWIQTRHERYFVHRSRPVRVLPGETAVLEDVELRPNSTDVEGPYVLSLWVQTPEGRPVEGALVRIARRMKHENGAWTERGETSGKTGPDGHVELEGGHLGEKALVVDGRPSGLRYWTEVLPVSWSGVHEHYVVLDGGLAITGRLRTVDGEVPAGFGLRAYVERNGPWFTDQVDAEGRFRLAGLGPDAEYTVEGGGGDWSLFRVRGVPAGREGLELAVKREGDPRDVGLHCAELHGRVVLAATGEPHPVRWDAVDLWHEHPGISPGEGRRDVLPNWIHPPSRQSFEPHEPPPPAAEFHLTGLRANGYVLIASVPGFAPALAGPFDLGEGELRSGIELRLHRGAAVEGRVLDVDGAPLEGAWILVTGEGPRSEERLEGFDENLRATGGRQRFYDTAWVTTDALGRFRLGRLPPDLPLRIAALHPYRERAVSGVLDLREGGTLTGLELRVPKKRTR